MTANKIDYDMTIYPECCNSVENRFMRFFAFFCAARSAEFCPFLCQDIRLCI